MRGSPVIGASGRATTAAYVCLVSMAILCAACGCHRSDVTADPDWGPGVKDVTYVRKRAISLVGQQDTVSFAQAEGMLMAMSWEQACRLYRTVSTPNLRHLLARCLFGWPSSRECFLGLQKDDLVNHIGNPDLEVNGAWIYTGYTYGKYLPPVDLCRYRVVFDLRGKVTSLEPDTDSDIQKNPFSAAQTPSPSMVWGRGVDDVRYVRRKIDALLMDGVTVSFWWAEGMLSMLTWDQACRLYRTAQVDSEVKSIVLEKLLTPTAKKRLIGQPRDGLRRLLGPPDAVVDKTWIYAGFRTEAVGKTCGYVFSFNTEGNVEDISRIVGKEHIH